MDQQAQGARRPQVSYEDDIALAATQPADSPLRLELLECGVEIVEPSSIGYDYPYKIQVKLGDGITEYVASTDHPPDLEDDHGIRIWTLAQRQRCAPTEFTLAKAVVAQAAAGAPRVLGRHVWTRFDELGIAVRCIPGTLQRRTDRRINEDAEKRCNNCRFHDRAAGQEEYNAITHTDEPFGGDRQMWKDIADREAGNRKLRRLEAAHVVFCMEHDALLDERMEACEDWEADDHSPPREAPGAPWEGD